MKRRILSLLILVVLSSCASKKEILYMQDAVQQDNSKVNYQSANIQPNDILKISVESTMPEAAIPYNKTNALGAQPQNVQVLQLDGYLVSVENTINFPVLGEISTANKTTKALEDEIKDQLTSGGHLVNPTVNVRLLNAKVTILGEVKNPGTYSFTEQNITILQALGYAGDLTINGKRDDILITREVDGVRKISHIDLTSSAFMNSEFYFIKPNDNIIVNPNDPKVKSAGFIGNVSTILTIASLALSVTILLTRQIMENQFNNSFFGEEDKIDIKQVVRQYLSYWPWFMVAVVVSLLSAYAYLRYAPRIYETYSKVKVLDESEGLELPTSALIFKRSNINLENEIEILSSFLIMNRVVRQLNLNTVFYEEGTIQTSQIDKLPLDFLQKIKSDSITKTSSYRVLVKSKGFQITNLGTDKVFDFKEHSTFSQNHTLPFEIKLNTNIPFVDIEDTAYNIVFKPLKEATLSLKNKVIVEAIGEQSDLLKLSIKGESKELSEKILETLMNVFNEDGIKDRQLVSERTIDFIDARFKFLAKELDSIEIGRQGFKQDNNIVDIQTDAQIGLEQRTKSEEEVFALENQLELSELLINSLTNDSESGLLPVNIGIENVSVNSLILEYNTAVINRDKVISSGGKNNPVVQLAITEVQNLKSNIDRSLKSYSAQVKASLGQLKSKNRMLAGRVSQIPEQERLFKAIDRQQKIKESLYLLLLQKREEAAINLAITEPSIKVVESALSGIRPISPKPSIVYAGALMAGLLIPFGILYLLFMLDTKLHSKEDINTITSKIPVIGEIPDLRKKKDIIFNDPNDRTPLAESFRILSSNVDFILPVKDGEKGKIIYCTSTIKGEGKTYVSLNLSLALSSINKKVLLIGADLRNPQIHTHISEDKQKPGLSNYLHDVNYSWQDALINGFEKHPNHHIILSGSIPPNPAHLLTNGRFKKLIDEAKEVYDYVVVDTAPTILVTDTMLISQLADATIYITRANYTEKNLLNFSKELSENGKLKNMAYVLNSVGAKKSQGYGYNYGYGYGYGSMDDAQMSIRFRAGT